MRTSSGLTILELLIITSVLAILTAVGFPVMSKARARAFEANAQIYAYKVYKASYGAMLETNPYTIMTTEDCVNGYTAGRYAANKVRFIDACSVESSVNNEPIVTIVSNTGKTIVFPLN